MWIKLKGNDSFIINNKMRAAIASFANDKMGFYIDVFNIDNEIKFYISNLRYSEGIFAEYFKYCCFTELPASSIEEAIKLVDNKFKKIIKLKAFA